MTNQTNLPSAVKVQTTTLLMDPASFEHLYRVGKMLAMSALFPEQLRKGSPEQAAANGALVMNMASRLNEDPLTVAQNIYFVGGKPGWSASYMISKANQHGVFKDPIDWKVTGSGDDLSVTAHAVLTGTGKQVSATCDMEMARNEGWTKNAKYKSMPEQMLRYRSATFLIRLYCPEVMIGIPSQVEIEFQTMKDITPREEPKSKEEPKPKPASDETPHDPETGEVVDDKEEPEADEPEGDEGEKEDDAADEKPSEADMAKVQAEMEKRAKMERVGENILNDLTDGVDVDVVLEGYELAMGQMKKEFPDLFEKLEKDIQKFREEAGG